MIAKYLNEHCACRTFDPKHLSGLCQELTTSHPHLFSATTVFISPHQLSAIKESIQTIETAIQNEAFQSEVLIRSPQVAQKNWGTHGVFMGYDYHLSDDGPKLIEINTNAGGALLNLELARAQDACCDEKNLFFEQHGLNDLEKIFFEMFQNEWKLQKGSNALKRIAIVDQDPPTQYLYPEFQLMKNLFEKFGVEAIIADPRELHFKSETLFYKNHQIDLVYNRLTDFYLHDFPDLKAAYESGAVVLTPAPHHHALYANKLNLVKLSQTISSIPQTLLVADDNAEELWAQRKNYFFKPLCGFGSKATYRGDKLTRGVWQEILKGEYVAQALVPPSKRLVKQVETETDLKMDLRAYTYQGRIQLLAARLYAGQTTNFRTPGGGFAPVYVVQGSVAAT